jgi:hypothetical protein
LIVEYVVIHTMKKTRMHIKNIICEIIDTIIKQLISLKYNQKYQMTVYSLFSAVSFGLNPYKVILVFFKTW